MEKNKEEGMTIFVIVDHGDYYGPYTEGIFTTREAAEKWLANQKCDYGYDIDEYCLNEDGEFVWVI